MTVLPLPVARERPRRREPWARLMRTEVMDSSWYGRSWMLEGPLLCSGLDVVKPRAWQGEIRLERCGSLLPALSVAAAQLTWCLEMSVGRM